MIVVLRKGHTQADIQAVEDKIRTLGYEPVTLKGEVRTVINALGDETAKESLELLLSIPCVERVVPIQKPYKLITREAQPETRIVKVGSAEIGGDTFHIAAGPCAVESQEQMTSTGKSVAASGATLLRGGAYKPRTSPYSYQGMGADGLKVLSEASAQSGLPTVTEVVNAADLPAMQDTVDMLQIGARNALNYALLEAVAATGKPVLLKRGMASTVEEWLLAAEYLVKNGNPNVVLCERGIRTFETATRNTLDISAVALAKQECNLPVFVDPSHAAGRADLILPLCKAAIAVGADGLIIEVHPDPSSAVSDQAQQLAFPMFKELMETIAPFISAVGRRPALQSS